jgi:hypothetical protein
MSLSCDSGYDVDGDWWWIGPYQEEPLSTRRARKCCSCKAKISIGEISRKVERYRKATEFEETRGISDGEVQIANWYLCETCGDLSDSLTELKFCYTLGDDSLKKQIIDYRREDEIWKRKYARQALTATEPAP